MCFKSVIFKVCISSLWVNNKQIFVGENGDLPYFLFDNDALACGPDKMTTPLLTIQNETVVASRCKGLFSNSD